jgi:hypothetical protein
VILNKDFVVGKSRGNKTVAVAAALALLVFAGLTAIGFWQWSNGPSPDDAFRTYLSDPIPASVKNIRIHYSPHMKGSSVYLAFDIDPADLELLIPMKDFKQVEYYQNGECISENGSWAHESTFRSLDPDDGMNMKTAWLSFTEGEDFRAAIAISDDRRKVYYHRFTDADIARARTYRGRTTNQPPETATPVEENR